MNNPDMIEVSAALVMSSPTLRCVFGLGCYDVSLLLGLHLVLGFLRAGGMSFWV